MADPTAVATDPGIDPVIQRAIIQHELDLWINTRFQAQVRHRAHKRAGFDQAALDGIMADLTRAEAMVAALTEELAAVPLPSAKEAPHGDQGTLG